MSRDRTLTCIYVAASPYDARCTRICIASIRHFYPDVQIRLLAGGRLERGLAEELNRHWRVELASAQVGDWGWGFVKLEPLFGPPGERFMVVDSDTVFAGPVLQVLDGSDAEFLVDDEQQSEADTTRLYYDWRKVAKIDPSACRPEFVFNSGQWFGTAGILARRDFAPFVDWSAMPPRLKHPTIFMPGDQGVLNYVLNQRAAKGLISVERRKIMQWPGHGMAGLSAEKIKEGQTHAVVVHWAGFDKGHLNRLPGADVLYFFERAYYGSGVSCVPLRWWRQGRYEAAAFARGPVQKFGSGFSKLARTGARAAHFARW